MADTTTRVKIVDDFNGYEGPTFADRTDAEAALKQRRADFYAHPGMQNAQFRQIIVSATATWGWNERQNQFVWE